MIPDMYWETEEEATRFIRSLENQIISASEELGEQDDEDEERFVSLKYLNNFMTISGERERAINFFLENIQTILFSTYVLTKVRRKDLE